MLNLTFPQIIGFLTTLVAILVKIIGFPDQIKKNFIRKSTYGLSPIFFVLAFLSYMLWTVHGIYQKDGVLIIGQGVGLLTTGIILYQIIIYKK
ncbi:hypothetical protein COX73_02940 [bacterium (Candidatus Gribaldobacteria) CG_4_10_14_0_2_um_filter_36_18]|uniref:MtN3 and saliva related transmembrane protein n=1 Tax=bacterium (Candidatus Gribaldobacteria) CG_4_10_14_0_2_um_filter_36_18 TaxID=2014264 RepID=A0A2M7VK36_9BACT|nr:MAG: hypothetical protein COX73_02940 [bacterium (Candidatus Gribaldobacteria) CG_4_10_14_0_2_um_filter_36_18]